MDNKIEIKSDCNGATVLKIGERELFVFRDEEDMLKSAISSVMVPDDIPIEYVPYFNLEDYAKDEVEGVIIGLGFDDVASQYFEANPSRLHLSDFPFFVGEEVEATVSLDDLKQELAKFWVIEVDSMDSKSVILYSKSN
jgi:hypothetical protein